MHNYLHFSLIEIYNNSYTRIKHATYSKGFATFDRPQESMHYYGYNTIFDIRCHLDSVQSKYAPNIYLNLIVSNGGLLRTSLTFWTPSSVPECSCHFFHTASVSSITQQKESMRSPALGLFVDISWSRFNDQFCQEFQWSGIPPFIIPLTVVCKSNTQQGFYIFQYQSFFKITL